MAFNKESFCSKHNCCHQVKVQLPSSELPTNPEEIKRLLFEQSEIGRNFRSKIHVYNNQFTPLPDATVLEPRGPGGYRVKLPGS